MIVVTGGAGFIGSALVARLNEMGQDDVLVVDELRTSSKWKNLNGKRFSDYLHKEAFLKKITGGQWSTGKIRAIFHMGACSSTTETDVDFLMENNYRYSQVLAEWCIQNQVRFVYASSAATYGDGALGFSDADSATRSLRPLNPYGYSKQAFDLWLLHHKLESACVGLKFFNVFGPNEYHKGDMASVIYKAYHQIMETGQLRLFKSYKPEYKDGEQKRDFVYIKDCIDVMTWLLEHPEVNGIFNLGTGKARTWNDLADAVFKAMNKPHNVLYFDMPENIRDAYQYWTEAEMKKLRAAGYKKEFGSLETSIDDYVVNYLTTGQFY